MLNGVVVGPGAADHDVDARRMDKARSRRGERDAIGLGFAPRQIVQRRSQAIGQAHGTCGPIGKRSEIDQIDRGAGDHLEPAGLFLNPNPALGLDHQNGADDRTGDDRHDPERFQGAVERMTG